MIEHLTHTKYTPLVALHKAIERVDEIDSLVLITRDKGGEHRVDWTNQKCGDLAFAFVVFQKEVLAVSEGDYGWLPPKETA